MDAGGARVGMRIFAKLLGDAVLHKQKTPPNNTGAGGPLAVPAAALRQCDGTKPAALS